MSGITWIHLSDWHQKGPDFDRQVVRDALIKDLRERTSIDPILELVDFVVFSGDLAYNGESDEYETARRELLDPVLEVVGIKPETEQKADRLFIVPGNHDLSRECIYEMLPPQLQKTLVSDELVQKWLTDDRKRARVLEPFEAYRKFVSGYTGQDSPNYASILRLKAGNRQIALLGLNSAWMCARNKNEQGEVNDYGFTLVGEPQVHDALAEIADADLRIAILHHPFDSQAKFDRNHIEARLERECHFILRGHEHNPRVRCIHSTDGEHITIPAGSSYNRRIVEDTRYINAYNLVHLDFESGKGMVYLRRWSDSQNSWIEDNDSYSGGKFTFPLPEDLTEQEPDTSASSIAAYGIAPADTRRLQAAEQRYRDLLLDTSDIINLANMPEQDRHIAQRQLELRRLYVPLRVWVEVGISQEKDELDQTDKLWESLEQRRATSLRGPLKEELERDKRKRYPIGERLEKARRLVVLGDPGSGKTTLTRWIATAFLLRLKNDLDFKELPDVATLPDVDWLPIIVRCRDLDGTCLGGSLDDILKHTLRKAELSDDEATDVHELLRLRLQEGNALLMLDGLDEITDSAARACFCHQLEQIVRAFPAAPIIATSRIVGYREMGYKLGQDFEHLTLADLTTEEKDDFARRWCALTELPERRTTATEELIHDIHSADRIERLTGNPMLLTTMALVKRKIGKLPNRRAELYWEAVQVLLNWRREVDEPLDSREAIPQLEYLAYAMCDQGVQQMRQDEILNMFAHMREDYPNVHAVRNRSPEDFLKRLESRTGILVEAGRVPHLGMQVPVYEFRHLTFQEYLAARALVDGRFPNRNPKHSLAENVAPLASRTTESANTRHGFKEASVVENWLEALRLCTAICNDDDVDDVLHAILTPQDGDPSSTVRARTILAALCLADEPNASEQIAEQVFLLLVQQVGNMDGGGIVKSNLDAVVIELSRTHWADALRAALLDELHICKLDIRSNVGSLIGMSGESTTPMETEKLASWLTEQVRRLQESDDPDAIYTALSIMELAFHMRIELINGLVDALFARLVGSALMAFAAAWALAWLNRNDIWQPNTSEMKTLVAFLSNQDSDPKAVRFVTWIIKKKQYKHAGKHLVFWLENPFADVRSAVAEALGAIKSETAVEPLIARLEDEDAEVRRAVALALGAIKSETAVQPLIERLEDEDADVRSAVAQALGAIKSETAVEPLIVRLEHKDVGVRSAVAQALGAIKSETAVQPLIARLEDEDADVRRAVLSGLAQGLEEIDRKLLSCDLDGFNPFFDPREPINDVFAKRAASELELSVEDVQARYEPLAERFGLCLAWHEDDQ